MSSDKIFSAGIYGASIAVFISALGLGIFGVGIFVAVWQTELLVDRHVEFFQRIEIVNSEEIGLKKIIGELESQTKNLSIFRAFSYAFLGFAAVGGIVFSLMYIHDKKIIDQSFEKAKFNFITPASYSILMALFFSVGLAFYFSAVFTEMSNLQTSTEILSLLDKNSIVGTNLLMDFLSSSIVNYFISFYYQTYFMGVFVLLSIGYIVNRCKVTYFGSSLFFASLIISLFWFVIHVLL